MGARARPYESTFWAEIHSPSFSRITLSLSPPLSPPLSLALSLSLPAYPRPLTKLQSYRKATKVTCRSCIPRRRPISDLWHCSCSTPTDTHMHGHPPPPMAWPCPPTHIMAISTHPWHGHVHPSLASQAGVAKGTGVKLGMAGYSEAWPNAGPVESS